MKNKTKQCIIGVQIETLLSLYPASELEDCLFDVFQTSYIEEEINRDEREKRSILHSAMRDIFRACNHQHHNCKKDVSCIERKPT